MKKVEFKSVFESLCDYYNRPEDKNNPTIIEIYFDQLKYYDIEEWNLIQKEIFRTIRVMPKISEIEVIGKTISRDFKAQKQKKLGECKRCYNSGYIIGIIGDYNYALACNCSYGDIAVKHTKRYDEIFPENPFKKEDINNEQKRIDI